LFNSQTLVKLYLIDYEI